MLPNQFLNAKIFPLVFAMDVGGWAASDVVIVAAQRTPIGSLNGNLSSHKASSLGTIVIESLLKKSNVSHPEVSEVILGQALTAGNFLLITIEYAISWYILRLEYLF